MSKFDPYAVLGVTPEAGRRQLEVSFHRLLCRRPPPDREARRLIEEAYITLTDPAKRAAYDRDRGFRVHPAFSSGQKVKALRLFKLGTRAMGYGDWVRAAHAFERAVAFQPWEAVYRSHLGLALATLGTDTHRARELCLEALKLEPGNPLYKQHLAAVYLKVGLVKRARRVLDHSNA